MARTENSDGIVAGLHIQITACKAEIKKLKDEVVVHLRQATSDAKLLEGGLRLAFENERLRGEIESLHRHTAQDSRHKAIPLKAAN